MEQGIKIETKISPLQSAYQPGLKSIKKEKDSEQEKSGNESVRLSLKSSFPDDKKEKNTHIEEVQVKKPEKISRKFFVDEITGKIGVRIINEDSQQVKQIPPEYQMAISRYIKVMEMAKS